MICSKTRGKGEVKIYFFLICRCKVFVRFRFSVVLFGEFTFDLYDLGEMVCAQGGGDVSKDVLYLVSVTLRSKGMVNFSVEGRWIACGVLGVG